MRDNINIKLIEECEIYTLGRTIQELIVINLGADTKLFKRSKFVS